MMSITRLDSTALPICSIVMPAYNREAELGRAITSILQQTLTNFELIIIDDCSTDATETVARSFDDRRIVVHRLSRNGGASHARNVGIDLANSQWIAFQDSDDQWLPELLERHRKAFEDDRIAVSFCKLEQRYGDEIRHYPNAAFRLGNDVYSQLLETSFISTQTMAVRKWALRRVDGFDESLPRLQDWDLALRLAREKFGFAYTPEALAIAHESANSLTKSAANGVIAREAILEKHREAFAKRRHLLARHRYIIGSMQQKAGLSIDARRSYLRSAKANPLNIKTWVKLGRNLIA